MMRRLALILALATPVQAGTLEGRLVTFSVETWDNREAPLLAARGRTVTVGQGTEFGLDREGFTGGLDVVPVDVEIGPTRIELSYPKGIGRFYEAKFNGYVLRFETDCALFDKVAIDLIQPDTSSIQQAVFEYASRAAAQDAFTRTARRARQCDQRNAVSGNTVQVLSNGAAPIQYKGVPGVWTRETQAGRGPGGRVVYDAYTVTLLVGESIQQVTLTIVGEGRAADVQRSSADTLALTLAKRWERGTSRSR